ncbi:MAG: sodium:solute symporter, partial [Chthoniobacterales bacterium]
MNMQTLDWVIVGGLIALLLVIAAVASRLTRSVADFLAANRSAGRYLLSISSGMSGMGAISIAAIFEKYYQAGFGAYWWGQMLGPIGLVMALSGFVIYRYRETRALTMAQFFEMRYSRNFRIYAGVLAWVSGVLNYGIFPAITSRFIIHFTGLPETFSLGGWELSTFSVVMIVMLTIAVLMATLGGQIAIMITD